ncbi:MAG: LysR family transcriptional regulator [Beijerinckiaceae bacterium]
MVLNLRQLLYYTTAAEMGNITAAAEKLHIAQPALATQIKELEKQLDTPLLTRHSRGVQMTTAGRVLLDRAKKLLAEAEDIEIALAAFSDPDTIQLSLGISPSLARFLGTKFVLNDLLRSPGVTINLIEDRSPALLRSLEAGVLDIALAYDVPERNTISRHALVEEDYLYVSGSNEFPRQSTISFTRALRGKLILTGESGMIRSRIEQEAKRLALRLELAYEVHSIDATKALLFREPVGTIIPWILAAKELKSGELYGTLIDRPHLGRVLYVVEKFGRTRYSNNAKIQGMIGKIADALLKGAGRYARALD